MPQQPLESETANMFVKFSKLRKAIRQIALLSPIALLSACMSLSGMDGDNIGPTIDPRKPVPVALLVPHGAPDGDVQRLARDLENAARMAVRDLKGAKIDLRVYATAGNVGQSTQAAKRAVNEGAKIIIGPLYAEAANAVAKTVSPQGINVMSFSNNPSIAGGNLFILGPTYNNTATQMAEFAAAQGKKRVVAVYSKNLAGELGKEAIQAAMKRKGTALVGLVGYDFSEAGVQSAVPKIKSTVAQTNADAIFLTANAAGALPMLSQVLPAAGISSPKTQYLGLTRWDTPSQALQLSGLQNGWFAMPDPARSAQFESRFKAAYGNSPHVVSSLAYDGIAAIGALVAKGKRSALQTSSLTQNAGFQGATGVFRLRSGGTNERSLAIATIRNKRAVILKPAAKGFGGALSLF